MRWGYHIKRKPSPVQMFPGRVVYEESFPEAHTEEQIRARVMEIYDEMARRGFIEPLNRKKASPDWERLRGPGEES